MVVAIEREFQVKMASSEESREALSTIAHLAEFIRKRAPAEKLPS
jgi:acyl carrier protein